MKLLLSLLCVLGLSLSSVTASAAGTPTSSTPGCTMGGEMPDMPPDHSTMDCCTATCQAPSSAALLPMQSAASDLDLLGKAEPSGGPAKQLTSVASSGLDPPPRA